LVVIAYHADSIRVAFWGLHCIQSKRERDEQGARGKEERKKEERRRKKKKKKKKEESIERQGRIRDFFFKKKRRIVSRRVKGEQEETGAKTRRSIKRERK